MTLITYLTRVHFADGVLEEALWAEMESGQKQRPLILADSSDPDIVLDERLMSSLPVRAQPAIFSDIPHIPTESSARDVAKLYQEKNCDVLLAFGSGRAIDLAKIARVAIAHDSGLAKFSYRSGGSRRIGDKLPDMFAIPGISGFGAAVSAHAPLILNSGERALVMCKKLIPNVTICDPTLTLNSTAVQSASAGAGAITHCIEAFISKGYNPPAEGIALDGLNRAVTNLPMVLQDNRNLLARREMMAAGLNGALALQKGLGASHAISNALEAVSDLALDQGALNRISLPSVLHFNRNAAPSKFDMLRKVFDLDAEDNLAEGVNDYFNNLPLPKSLSQLGLELAHLEAAATVASEDLATDTNPRPVEIGDYLSIMRSVH
ncbi:MAG: iron-containing alcohol dehydrogenase [Rhizobiaceae bacterium]